MIWQNMTAADLKEQHFSELEPQAFYCTANSLQTWQENMQSDHVKIHLMRTLLYLKGLQLMSQYWSSSKYTHTVKYLNVYLLYSFYEVCITCDLCRLSSQASHIALHCISPHHRHQQKWWKLHTSKYICPMMYSKGSQACVPRNGFKVCFLQQSVQHCETGGTQPQVSWPSDHRKRLQLIRSNLVFGVAIIIALSQSTERVYGEKQISGKCFTSIFLSISKTFCTGALRSPDKFLSSSLHFS